MERIKCETMPCFGRGELPFADECEVQRNDVVEPGSGNTSDPILEKISIQVAKKKKRKQTWEPV